MPDQSNDYTKVHLGKPVSLLGLQTGMGEGLLTGAGMARKPLAALSNPTSEGGEGCSPGPLHTACRRLSSLRICSLVADLLS